MLIALSASSSCSYLDKYKTPINESVTLDSSLIQDYSSKLLGRENFLAPFISNYNYGDKNLVYVASVHQEGPGTLTQKTIEKAMKEFKPDFLIVEGSAFTIISDPDDIAYASECHKKKYKFCREDAYAVNLALRAKIPFCYGEPSDAAIHNTLKKSGVTDEELIAFYTLRGLPALKREGQFNNKKLVELLNRSSKKFRADKFISVAQFKKLYKKKMNAEFKILNISDETISPQIDQNPMWSNKIAYAVDVLREQFLTKQIETRLNKYKKVLVVYGAEHLMKARPMFSRALGEPIDSRL